MLPVAGAARVVLALALAGIPAATAITLTNDRVSADFDGRGLTALRSLDRDRTAHFSSDVFSLTVGSTAISSDALTAPVVQSTGDSVTYSYTSGPYNIQAVYELKSGWSFVSKQLMVTRPDSAAYHVNDVTVFRGHLDNRIARMFVPRTDALGAGGYGIFMRFEDADTSNLHLDAVPSTSFVFGNLNAVNDGILPLSSHDLDIPRHTWWDHKGTTEWMQYTLDAPKEISSADVYWFDDGAVNGGCRVPASWTLNYWDGVAWQPVVVTGGAYGTAQDAFNRVQFKPVVTSQIRITANLKPGWSGGVLEWRLNPSDAVRPDTGLFALLQNPFLSWQRTGNDLQLTYTADMEWLAAYGPFASDRVCLGLYALTGEEVPAVQIPEWQYIPGGPPATTTGLTQDWGEVTAFSQCVRAFLKPQPARSTRNHISWCENDYQIDAGTAAGRTECKRIIDRAAEAGASNVLYTPANSTLSNPANDADAWRWEHILWLGLGQKIRTGAWNPKTDPIPANVQEMLDYARSRNVKLMAYIYPSLPFSQDSSWLDPSHTASSLGVRGYQDWLIDNIAAFHDRTGIAGVSFDYMYLTYGGTSRYAQWFGCRRMLEELRRRVPDITIDSRQSLESTGPWSWLATSYPPPFITDEQPESYQPFPDLHTDRTSADHQRFAAWWYRVHEYCPPEVLPGFITHQTARNDDNGQTVMTPFRTRDWDALGWRYSVLSSIATAPFKHVMNMLPARDPDEFNSFPDADKQWLRGWLDWTDANAAILHNGRPIMGQPALGKVDGTAAFSGAHGFVFLFNPNYRKMSAVFALDQSIGLSAGGPFMLKELYPLPGRLWGKAGVGFWNQGDQVTLTLDGTQATILEVTPAPSALTGPMLFNSPGGAALTGDRLALNGVSGEAGTDASLLVALPQGQAVSRVTLNGSPVRFDLQSGIATVPAHFPGVQFGRARAVDAYQPLFTGGTVNATFTIPRAVTTQLQQRKALWPIPYTAQDLRAAWLGPHRLLFYIQIAEPADNMAVTLKIDGQAVALLKAYTTVRTVWGRFTGHYADVSTLAPDVPHTVSLTLPSLRPGQYQGMFFENVETEYALAQPLDAVGALRIAAGLSTASLADSLMSDVAGGDGLITLADAVSLLRQSPG